LREQAVTQIFSSKSDLLSYPLNNPLAGRSKEEVVVSPDSKPTIRPTMALCYSFDKRIEDGRYGARALEMIKRIMEDPALELLTNR